MGRQTHCTRGHEYAVSGVYESILPNGRVRRRCKPCADAANKAHRDRLTSEERAQRRKKFPSYSRNREYSRRYRMKVMYQGLSPEEFHGRLVEQDGLCIICLENPATQIDHDHKTGRVRGILCGPCNRALGLFKDDAENLQFAAEYVGEVA